MNNRALAYKLYLILKKHCSSPEQALNVIEYLKKLITSSKVHIDLTK